MSNYALREKVLDAFELPCSSDDFIPMGEGRAGHGEAEALAGTSD